MGLLARAVADPVAFARCVLGVEQLTEDQQKILRAVATSRRTIVHSGQGTGKTFAAAIATIWFLYRFVPSKIITTSKSWRQVIDQLWGEIKTRHRNSRIPLGAFLLPRAPLIRIAEDHFAEGFSTNDINRVLGYHAQNLLVVIDEAGGVDPEIWEASQRVATAENNRILAIGNPTSPVGPFREATRNPTWTVLHVDGLNHPNVREGRDVIPGGTISKRWVDGIRDEYGEDSLQWKIWVRGQFPEEGVDTLIREAWVDSAFAREPLGGSDVWVIACDVARFGDDETVILTMHGRDHIKTLAYRSKDTMTTCGRIVQELDARGRDALVVIDDVGVGGGVTDRLREQGIPVFAFNGGLRAGYRPGESVDRRRERYLNLRAQAWHALADGLKAGMISLRPDRTMKAQLTAITYEIRSDAVLAVEKKEDLRERLPYLGSPDRADALVMAWWALRQHRVDVAAPKERRPRTWREEFAEISGWNG